MDGSYSTNFDSTTRTSATVMKNWNHFTNESGCAYSTSADWNSGTICDQSVKIRQVKFSNLRNHIQFNTAALKVRLLNDYNDTIDENETEYTSYISSHSDKQPMDETPYMFAIPFATGKIYSIWWDRGIDFEHLSLEVTKIF